MKSKLPPCCWDTSGDHNITTKPIEFLLVFLATFVIFLSMHSALRPNMGYGGSGYSGFTKTPPDPMVSGQNIDLILDVRISGQRPMLRNATSSRNRETWKGVDHVKLDFMLGVLGLAALIMLFCIPELIVKMKRNLAARVASTGNQGDTSTAASSGVSPPSSTIGTLYGIES